MASGRSAQVGSDSATQSTEERALLERLQREPGAAANTWLELARLRLRLGRTREAVEGFRAALAAGAVRKTVAYDYARALSDLGEHQQSITVIREALGSRNRDFSLVNLLGVVLKRSGRLREAIDCLEEARRLGPKSVSPWINLGNAHLELGEYERAVASFGRAARMEPAKALHWRLLGRAEARAGRAAAAISSFRRALTLAPRSQDATLDYCASLLDLSRNDAALELIAKACAAEPRNLDLRAEHGRVLRRLGRIADARAMLESVLEEDPANKNALLVLARMYEYSDRRKSNELLRRIVAAHPREVAAQAALCESLNRSRYGEEAAHIQEAYELADGMLTRFGAEARLQARSLRDVLRRCVDFDRFEATGTIDELGAQWVQKDDVSALHKELGSVVTFEDRVRLVHWHRAWGRRVAAQARLLVPRAPAIAGRRKLRIGLMSSDLRLHPVGAFALPLLDCDRDRFELYCYSFNEGKRDAVQARFESSAHAFRWWPQRSAEAIAEGIAADDLDLLFELGGSTAMNRLEVMAYHPARITASWLGYPHSAGLETIDRILVDPYLKPADPQLLIERPLELPHTWVVVTPEGFEPVPVVPEPPVERTGYITFGTMNNPYKFNRGVFDAWALVMGQVPGSHFRFVRPEGDVPAFRRNVLAEFAKRGVEAARVAFVAVRGTHLQHYNSIDVALDTFPHVGGTTTCETIWMGVPTVTLVGPAFFERMSCSNLTNAGLGDLCARTTAEYVSIAVALAGDRARLRSLRRGLRDSLRSLPLGDEAGFVRDFYAAAEAAARE